MLFTGGGKSKADCYSAIAKNKARAKVDSGLDANSPKNFGKVLAHCTSLANVTVKVGKMYGKLDPAPEKIEDLRDLREIIFLRNKILVRKVPGIGDGRLLELQKKMEVNVSYEYEIMNSDLDEEFRPQRKTRQPFYKSGTVVTEPMYDCEEEKTSTDQPIPETGVVFY